MTNRTALVTPIMLAGQPASSIGLSTDLEKRLETAPMPEVRSVLWRWSPLQKMEETGFFCSRSGRWRTIMIAQRGNRGRRTRVFARKGGSQLLVTKFHTFEVRKVEFLGARLITIRCTIRTEGSNMRSSIGLRGWLFLWRLLRIDISVKLIVLIGIRMIGMVSRSASTVTMTAAATTLMSRGNVGVTEL